MFLPRELQCEVISVLPFHYEHQMLLLSRPIAKNCVELVRKQKQKFEWFENRWDSTACHPGLTIIERDRLIAQLTGDNLDARSVCAERPIPKGNAGIFYFEVTILGNRRSFVSIGLGTKQMPLDECVGWNKGTYSYDNSVGGKFWGHAVEGSSYSNGRPYIKGKPKFGVGDVIGCGVDLATRQIIYTKNAQRLDTTGLFVANSDANLFPCVTLFYRCPKIEANFGPNFKFNF